MAVPGRVRDYNNSTGETISTTRTAAGAAATLASIATGDVSAENIQAAIAELADEKVNKALFDANTILAATTDNTPVALTVAASRFVGRKSTGGIAALTPTEARTELDVPTTAEAVLDTLYDANSLVIADTDNTPIVKTVAASTILGRKAAGGIDDMTAAEALEILSPVGDVVTFSVPAMMTQAPGIVLPSFGAGPLGMFDKADDPGEGGVMQFTQQLPDHWVTVDVYYECINVSGSSGNVRWQFDPSAYGGAAAQAVTVASGAPGAAVQNLVASGVTLGSVTVGGTTIKGLAANVQRLGVHAADTLDADEGLSTVHLRRAS